MGNVISFPKERTKNMRTLQRAEAKRIFISLSVLSVIMVVVSTHEQMLSRGKAVSYAGPDVISARGIASAGDRNMIEAERKAWEQKIVQRLGKAGSLMDRKPASSEPIDLIDQLRYGPLAGKYTVVNAATTEGSKISEIHYVENKDNFDQPVFIDPKDFLKEYRSTLNVDYVKAVEKDRSPAMVTYQLVDENGSTAGEAAFSLDSEGRTLSARFTRLSAAPF